MSKLRDALDALQGDIDHAGGITGGWIKDDHDCFLKFLSKYKSATHPALIENVSQMVRCSEQDVLDHASWYAQHLKRSERGSAR